MGKGNDILPIKTLGFSLGDWIPITNLDSHLHPEVEGQSHRGRVRNALSPSLMSLLTSSTLSAVVAIVQSANLASALGLSTIATK